jgi:hypothetical protein
LAKHTAGYSGAGIVSLIRSALCLAMDTNINNICITQQHFIASIHKQRIDNNVFNKYYPYGIFRYNDTFDTKFDNLLYLVNTFKTSNTNNLSIMIRGNYGIGTTAIAAYCANSINYQNNIIINDMPNSEEQIASILYNKFTLLNGPTVILLNNLDLIIGNSSKLDCLIASLLNQNSDEKLLIIATSHQFSDGYVSTNGFTWDTTIDELDDIALEKLCEYKKNNYKTFCKNMIPMTLKNIMNY